MKTSKFKTCTMTIYRMNPENYHMEFFDRLTNVTVNGIIDYIKSLRIGDSSVIFDTVIVIHNPTIYYMVDLEGEDLGDFYVKIQKKVRC